MATIKVKAAHEDGRVSFFEKHPAHPGGQVFIVGNGDEVEAGETAALKQAIRAGRLVTTQQTPVARQQTPAVDTRAAEKWRVPASYDGMNVADAVEYIRSLSKTEQAIMLEYERRNKNRPTLLREFD